MDFVVSTTTMIIVAIGVVACLAGGIAIAGLLLALSCRFFIEHFVEWKIFLSVVDEAERSGRSVFKQRRGKGKAHDFFNDKLPGE